MTHADHIAQRKTVRAEGGKTNARQQRGAPAAGQQVVPEKGNNPDKTQRRRRPEPRRRALTEENKAVNGVVEHRHGKDHRFQPGVDMRRRGIKTPEVKAEHAASLQHAKQMIAQRQLAHSAQGEQHNHHRGAGHGEAPENRHRGRHGALLQENGNPGGSPDDHDQSI